MALYNGPFVTQFTSKGNDTRPYSAVGSKSDCRSRGYEFDPGLVMIDHEILSIVILFQMLIQERLLLVTSESLCTKYWLTV